MREKAQILIVDDESSARDTLEAILFQEGYELAFAANGAEAMEEAAALTPDLILLDVMMPDMDGFEVCRRLRADPLLAEVPVVMVTALDDRASRLAGIEAGADDFISKPVDRVELRARVRTTTRLNRYHRLLVERAKFEWVVEQAEDGYLMVGESNRVLYANPRARLYLGLPEDSKKSISETFLELARKQYHCEPQEAWTDWPELPATALQSPRYLVRPESPTSNAFWLRVDLTEMSSSERHLLRLRDVTSSVAAQRSMWTFHDLVSHKLRTPLVGMLGYLQLLEEEASTLTESQASFLEAVHRSTLRLRSEIEDIVQYVEAANKTSPGHGRCDLPEVPAIIGEISAGLDLAAPQISYQGLEEPGRVFVGVSRRAMEMVLWELFENAKKFHPEGSPAIDVTISGISGGVCIQVGDDGLTLSPDQLAGMWVPYYQAEKYFTGQVPGMGLGLSMVATLIWNVGGTCRAYNREDGPGIVVELVLPWEAESHRVPHDALT